MSSSSDNPSTGGRPPIIVGLGASAGGLEAFQKFFDALPPDSGAAYVIVQHLDPDHPTLMPELLAKHTSMRVSLVEDETRVRANAVHVIPPNASLELDGELLRVQPPVEERGHRTPIDRFFRSLASSCADRAVGIVLSGTGSDGTVGLGAIKERGGMTMAQSSDSAKYDGMPRSAVATGLVDHVLAAEDMPAKLLDYIRHLEGTERRGEGIGEEASDELDEICGLLRERTGHDFGSYKRSTLNRRLRRRMQVLQVPSPREYVERLREDADEAQRLFQDFLIGVTQFFRNPEAFRALEEVLRGELENAEEAFRAWVPGCATGEEAYTLAMLLSDVVQETGSRTPFTLFATDIDERALQVARAGRYPEGIVEQVPPKALGRHFERVGDAYVVKRRLRESCIFSVHDVFRDPPFSKLNLLSCRNLLIYVNAELQAKLIPVLHHALRPGGFLFLGPAENVTTHAGLFSTVDRKNRIFRARPVATRHPLELSLAERAEQAREAARGVEEGSEPARGRDSIGRLQQRAVLERFAPPSIVVDRRGRIVHVSGRTGRYLEMPEGPLDADVVSMARRELRLPLRAALHQLRRSSKEVRHPSLEISAYGEVQRFDLVVRPLVESEQDDDGLALVVFCEHGAAVRSDELEETDRERPEDPIARQLESELKSTKEDLQTTIEELETSNEELLSMNEELQSSNEELQTSKEELQSVNEELETVNAELQDKVGALDAAHADLENLFESMEVPILFLSSSLRVKRFTPQVTDVFRLEERDLDRKITDITTRFTGVDLETELRRALIEGRRTRHRIRVGDERDYVLNVVPCRATEAEIAGIVLSFSDVTDVVAAQRAEARLAAIVDSMTVEAIIGRDLDDIVTSWNPGAEKTYGWSADEMIGRSIMTIVPEERREELEAAHREIREGRQPAPLETERLTKDGRRICVLLTLSPLKDAEDRVVGISAIARDVTRRVRAENERARSEALLRLITDALPALVAYVDRDLVYRLVNRGYERWFGRPVDEITGRRLDELLGKEAFETIRPQVEKVLAGEPVRFREQLISATGGARWVEAEYVPHRGPGGEIEGFVALVQDVSDEVEEEETLRSVNVELAEADRRKDQFLAMLAHELRNPLAPITNALELLRESGRETGERRRLHEMMRRQLHHLVRLVDDLLDLSRVSRGKITLQREPVDLVEASRHAIEQLMPKLEAQRQELEVDLPAEGEVLVRGDRARLEQVVANLLSNASKYTRPGGHVRLSVRAEDDQVVLEVSDDGVGIEPDLLPDVFDLFVQGDLSLARSEGGLGIGLTTVKHLVELHGGRIEAHSEGRGRGATFRASLPEMSSEEARAAVDARADEACPASAEPPEGTGKRILVVEDNEDSAHSLSLYLESKGHVVDVAHDGHQGVERALATRPAVIVLDIGLPGMDGYDCARAIRAELDDVKIVALSGYGRDEDRARARDAGFDAHVIKPPDLTELLRLIEGPARETASADG